MKLLHTLNLECQVAVKDFCAALQTLRDDVISLPVRSLRIFLIFNSFESSALLLWSVLVYAIYLVNVADFIDDFNVWL